MRLNDDDIRTTGGTDLAGNEPADRGANRGQQGDVVDTGADRDASLGDKIRGVVLGDEDRGAVLRDESLGATTTDDDRGASARDYDRGTGGGADTGTR